MLAAAGFRTTLIIAALIGSAVTFANGLFTPTTPYAVMFATLLIAGFARSFFFTSVNALAFADIDDRDASKATAMTSVLQQMSLAMGVAVAGTILELENIVTGTKLTLSDFQLAFMIIAVLTLLAVIPFLRMNRDAGQRVSGHRRPAEKLVEEGAH